MQNTTSIDRGFAILDPGNAPILNALRLEIFELTRQVFRIAETDPERGFNNFHVHTLGMRPGELNALRIELIRRVTADCDVKEMVFKAFETQLLALLGPDILAQRNCNLVLQPPGDPNPSELHRDAPANSPYELVVWVPLVNCFATKAMYILDIESTERAFERLDADPADWAGFEAYARSLAVTPSVPFGKALVFHTGCLHGSDINAEGETRVSLNVRYKNLFSPSGLKNQLQFFSPLRVSDVARLGSLLEARELQR